MGRSSEYEELVADYLADLDIRKSELYLAQGRVHREASHEALEAGWSESFAAMSERPADDDLRARFDAYDAEYRLRGIEPPYEQARGLLERMIASSDRAMAEMRKDPTRLRAADEAFAEEIAAYAAERERARAKPN